MLSPCAVVPPELDGAIVSTHYFLFEYDSGVLDPGFLTWYLRSDRFQSQIRAQGSTNYAAIRPSDVLGYELLLPLLSEQRRVSRALDRLLGIIERARRFTTTDTGLVGAYLGELFGDPYRSKPGTLRVAGWGPLDRLVSDVADGPHQTPIYTTEGVPFVTALNVAPGQLTFAPVKFISLEQHRVFQRRARAEAGDVLITKDGTIGLACTVDTDADFSFFVSVALVKPRPDVLDGGFLKWLIRAPATQRRIRERARGDMIKHLVLREIRALLCPALPLEVQQATVADIERVAALELRLQGIRQLQKRDLDALVPKALSVVFGDG